MFGSLGVWEIVFILGLALLIFGPRKLPEIGKQIGRGLGEFRRASNELKRQLNTEIALEDDPPRPRPVPSRPASYPPRAVAEDAEIAPDLERGAMSPGDGPPAPAAELASAREGVEPELPAAGRPA